MINQEVYNLTNETIIIITQQLTQQFNLPLSRYHREQNYIDQPQNIGQLKVSFPPYITLSIYNEHNQNNRIEKYNNVTTEILNNYSNYNTSDELRSILNNFTNQLRVLTQ